MGEVLRKCPNCRFNRNVIDMLKNNKPNEETISRLSDVFKIFSDPTRLRILWVLFDDEKCVAEICEALGMTQSAISHQLKGLKDARLVTARRDGKNTFYSLADEHIGRIIEQVLIHINE